MKKIRYFIEVSLVRIAVWGIPRLPRHVLLVLARCLGALAWRLDARGRATALENLRVALPEIDLSARKATGRAAYQNFARTFMDLFWGSRMTAENWSDLIKIRFDDPPAEAAARASGALWVTPHYGNFEMVSLAFGFFDLKLTVVAQDFKNPGLTEIFKQLRGHSGHIMIPQENAMIRLFKALKRHGHTAMLTDLNIKPSEAAAAIRCFGKETCVTTGHVMLARRLQLPIFPTLCHPLEDGTYDVTVHGPIWSKEGESAADTTQRIWDVFEVAIRKHPERWMWMYKHWRYLPAGEGCADYPDYANPNKAFRLLARSTPE